MKTIARHITLFGLLLLPNIYAMVAATSLNCSASKEIAYLAVVLTSIALPATLLKARILYF